MIYFSELREKKVITEDQVNIGNLEDVIFLASETPRITKFVIRDITGKKLIISVDYLKKLDNYLTIIKSFNISSLEENELHLIKNLLDKQIIDLKGHKIVRVNDVAIQDKGGLYIAGIDVGFLGILRGLGLEKPLIEFFGHLNMKMTSQFLSWGDIQPLELARGEVKLRKKEEKLHRIKPEDLAGYLEKTNIANTQRFLRILDEKKAANVIGSLNLSYRAELFRNYKPERAARLLELIDPDEAVDILLTLSERKRDLIINKVSNDKKKTYLYLLKYTTSQIGKLLTTEYLLVRPDDNVKDVIKKIKQDTLEFSSFHTIYVVNESNQLIGVFNLHELLFQELETPVYRFMIQNVIVLHITSSAEIGLNIMLKYKLAMLPVIDEEKNIIGVVAISDLADLFFKKYRPNNLLI